MISLADPVPCPRCREPMRLVADRTWRCGWCAMVVILKSGGDQ